ncbi:MAG: hypothetical protein U1E23_13520 [Reyranellaceae bacterium]
MARFFSGMLVGAAVAIVAYGALFIGDVTPTLASVPLHVFRMGTSLIWSVIAIAGMAAGFLAAAWLKRAEIGTALGSWIYIVLFCATLMAVAATGSVSFVSATLILLFGSVALVAGANVVALIRSGETIELQSNWGGLGGGLGGWRLSRVTALLLLGLLFTGAAALVGHTGPGQQGGAREQAPAAPTPKPGTPLPSST